MTILALESSAGPVSAAVARDGVIVSSAFENGGLTHSVTLMPMVQRVLANAGLKPAEADYIAVAAGPGSFTGLRIGAGTVKGYAWAAQRPCVGVSTLAAMAYLHRNFPGLVCPAMDARRGQVYTAVFDTSDGTVRRVAADDAISAAELAERLKAYGRPVLFVGDGAHLALAAAAEAGIDGRMPEGDARYQSAAGVALAAWDAVCGRLSAPDAQITDADGLKLNYLRLSQAERERLARGESLPINDVIRTT